MKMKSIRLFPSSPGDHRVSLPEAQLSHTRSRRGVSSVRSAQGQQAANCLLHVGKQPQSYHGLRHQHPDSISVVRRTA